MAHLIGADPGALAHALDELGCLARLRADTRGRAVLERSPEPGRCPSAASGYRAKGPGGPRAGA